jgi:DNA-binding SARP family transcriptional activator
MASESTLQFQIQEQVEATIRPLLETRQYDQAGQILLDTSQQAEQAQSAALASILLVTHQICQICEDCVHEGQHHQAAYGESLRRETELQQLLLGLLRESATFASPKLHDTSEMAQSSPSLPKLESVARTGWWQNLKKWVEKSEHIEQAGSTLVPVEDENRVAEPDTTVGVIGDIVLATTPEPDMEDRAAEPDVTERPFLMAYCLGTFRLYVQEQPINNWASRKGRNILKYLLLHRQHPVSKDILMDTLWPDADPSDTSRNLHQAVYSLRQTLRQERPDLQLVLYDKDRYLLHPEVSIWLDFEEFEEHFQAGQRLLMAGQQTEAMAEYSIAETLYQGDFLEEDLYEDWPTSRREYLRNLYLSIANYLGDNYLQQGGYTAAIALCQKILAKDNCNEEAHRRLMECYVAQGQRHLAVRQYQVCVQALKEELDLTPAEETIALYQRIITK